MLYSIHLRITWLPIVVFCTQQAHAQLRLTKADSSWFNDKIEFIQQAPAVLSSCIEHKNWRGIDNFATNWKLSEAPSEEFILAIEVLDFIQTRQFFVTRLPGNYLQLLEAYAKEIRAANNRVNYKYYIQLTSLFRYNAAGPAIKTMQVLRSWALQLKSTGKLNKTEIFFCDVFAGNILRPGRMVDGDESAYPDLSAFNKFLQHQIAYCDSSIFVHDRWNAKGTIGIMLGTWTPTGNARLLGNSASLSLLLWGYKHKRDEYDVILSYRFPHSTNQIYNVLRSDSLFSSNYYDGGYAGFDYTHFFIRKLRYELGITSAVGYDFFDFTSQSSDTLAGKNISPSNIGSFDFSNGLRFKYYINPSFAIGLAAKYHIINYCNKGGTDVGGNAFTLDLILSCN